MTKDKETDIEETYPGVSEQIERYKNTKLPTCPHCGSDDTAIVRAGLIGKLITFAASTRKIKLVLNKTAEMGDYYCNT